MAELAYQHMIHLLEKRRRGPDINEGNKVNPPASAKKALGNERRSTAARKLTATAKPTIQKLGPIL